MKADKGPFEIVDADDDACDQGVAFRNYACACYQTCLGIAAGLNWDDFSCTNCSGEVDQALLWQIRQVQRKDGLVKKLCEVPGATCYDSSEGEAGTPKLQLVSNNKKVKNVANES